MTSLSGRKTHSRHTAWANGQHKLRADDEVMTETALERGTPARFESRPNAAVVAREAGVPVLDVVVPVYNEQAALADSVQRLHRHLREQFPFSARITIADNASVDDTPRIAAELAAELSDVRVVQVPEKGRGRALHAAWSTISRPISPRSHRSSRRWCRGIPTWRSARGSAADRGSCAAPSARSSPA